MSLAGQEPTTPPPPPPASPPAPPPSAAPPSAPPPASAAPPPSDAPPAAENTAAPAGPLDPAQIPVELVNVRRAFGEVLAVADVSLRVPAGTILGVIGPSGSGKTTTIRMILGMLRPDAGEVRVLGEEPRHFRRRTRERIGYQPQSFVMYPDLTAKENVNFVAATFGLLWRKRRQRVREVME